MSRDRADSPGRRRRGGGGPVRVRVRSRTRSRAGRGAGRGELPRQGRRPAAGCRHLPAGSPGRTRTRSPGRGRNRPPGRGPGRSRSPGPCGPAGRPGPARRRHRRNRAQPGAGRGCTTRWGAGGRTSRGRARSRTTRAGRRARNRQVVRPGRPGRPARRRGSRCPDRARPQRAPGTGSPGRRAAPADRGRFPDMDNRGPARTGGSRLTAGKGRRRGVRLRARTAPPGPGRPVRASRPVPRARGGEYARVEDAADRHPRGFRSYSPFPRGSGAGRTQCQSKVPVKSGEVGLCPLRGDRTSRRLDQAGDCGRSLPRRRRVTGATFTRANPEIASLPGAGAPG